MKHIIAIALSVFISHGLDLQTLLAGKVQILIPTDFQRMSQEVLIQKYPSNNRPAIVFTDVTGTINLAVNHTTNRISLEQLPQALPVFANQFENLYPSIQWYRKEVTTLNERRFVVMEFITPAVDGEIYNLMFITELEGRLLMFNFNCTRENEGKWKTIAYQMMNSVNVL